MRTIAHLSDLHFGRTDWTVAAALDRELNARKPDLLIVSGDLTQRARVGQFREAMTYLAKLPRPQMLLAGNHDVPLFSLFRRLFSPLGRFNRIVTPEMVPVFRDDELLVIGLNTASRGSRRLRGFWKDGRVDPDDLARAAEQFRAAPSGVTKIAVTHHPFAAHDIEHAGDTVGNGPTVLKTLTDAGVVLFLGGHLHRAYRVSLAGGAISLQAGTACSDRRRGQLNSYNWLTVDQQAIEVEVRSFAGGEFTTTERTSLLSAAIPYSPA